jgi:hypothetical protein
MVQAQAAGDVSQALSARREEPAEQATFAELFDARPPAVGATADPVENSRDLSRNVRFSAAKQAPGVIDQEQVAAKRESFEHPFAK